MKKILNAIGGFFKKIGRWIKETAWIQPLLIVGAIFGLIMSIKPIANFINDITTVESESNFYKSNLKDYEFINNKIEKNGENDVTLVILIQKENHECEQCVNQQGNFDDFFAADHKDAENNRNYSLFVLDVASDYFVDEDGNDTDKSVAELIVRDWGGLDNMWLNDMGSAGFNTDTSVEINTNADHNYDVIPTPAILRFNGNECVGISMGLTDWGELARFCYATDVDGEYKSIPGNN